MLSVSQNWKEKLGNYLIPNRELLTPEELIKIEYTIDGQTLTFTKGDIISFSHKNSADLNSLTLPKNEIQFEIDNIDGRWNPDNPQGLYEKITEKQKVELYYGIVINGQQEWHKAGTFYMSGWDCPQNGLTASFTATSQFDFGKDKFGEQSYVEQPTFKDLCEKAFQHMGLSSAEYSIDESLDDYYVPIDAEHISTKYAWVRHESDSLYTENTTPVTNKSYTYRNFIYRDDAPELIYVGTVGIYFPKNYQYDFMDGESHQIARGSYDFATMGHYIGASISSIENDTAYYHIESIDTSGTYPKITGTKTEVTTTHSMGEAVGYVFSEDSTAYREGYNIYDGYYYESLGQQTVYAVDKFKDTTDAAVIQYCANAAMCRIRYDVNGKIYIEPMDTGGELSDYIIDLFTSYHQPEYVLSKQIKDVIINSGLVVSLAEDGENQQISNALITTQLHANLFAGWLGRVLNTRKTISGEYRCDPRIQPYDYIKTVNKYAVNETFITDVAISYAGSFKATYTGRVMKSVPSQDVYGLLYAGDKQRAGNTIS